MSDNIFEIASRRKFRFASSIGDLTTEQLWDLRLSGAGHTLDNVAKTVNNELKSISDESFVVTRPNPRKGELEMMLDIVKHVISVKMADRDKAAAAADRAEQRRKLAEALINKRDAALANMSEEELTAKLAELDGTA